MSLLFRRHEIIWSAKPYVLIEILPAHKNKELDLEHVVQGSQFESAVAMAMRVVILREGLAMEALSISYL